MNATDTEDRGWSRASADAVDRPARAGRPRWRPVLSDVSVATRLSLVALVVTLLSLSASAAVGLWRGATLAEGIVQDRLVSVADSRAAAVELYLVSVQRQLAGLASSPSTVDAIRQLDDGRRALEGSSATEAQRTELVEYYLTEISPTLLEARSSAAGASTLVPTSDVGVLLQSLYTVPSEIGDDGTRIAPELVTDARDGSDYSAAHASLHQVYAEVAARSQFDDVLLVAADSTVVYTTRKRIDFATNLGVGPWSGTGLATLVDQVADDPAGGARVSDLTAYGPALDRPTAFVAAPVRDGDTEVGVIAAAIPVERFDALLSGNGSWDGFNESGEAFLVAADGRMRSTARGFAASPTAYLDAAAQSGVPRPTEEQRLRMTATGTTALVQVVSSDLARPSASDPATITVTDPLGEEVVAARRGVDVGELGWTVVTQVTTEEINASIAAYVRNILFVMALFVVVVTFVVVRWSGRVMQPIRTIAARLRAVRLEEVPAAQERDSLGDRSPDEYVDLADSIDEMLARLEDRRMAVAARAAERARLVGRFLPAAIAERSEQTGGEVLDHVTNASVAVLVIEGLGELLHKTAGQEVRRLLATAVDEIDALAVDFGLERVKVTGDRYHAVCGATRPYLDHAPRAVGFAIAASDLIRDLAAEGGHAVVVHAGVDTGSVSVGLAERAGLVYDSWGPAVSGAARLASTAPAGQVAVSGAVCRQLPDDFVLADDGPDGDTVVVAHRGPAGGGAR